MDEEFWVSLLKGLVCAGLTFAIAHLSGVSGSALLISFLVFVAVGLASSIDFKLMHVRHQLHLLKYELQKRNDPELMAIHRQGEKLKRHGSRGVKVT